MKKLLLLLIVASTAISFSFRPADGWSNYTSREGHYSIDFPGTPAESTEEDTSDNGKLFTIHFATYFPSDTEGYMADWIDLRSIYPKNKTLKKILEDSRDGATQAINATNVITTYTSLGKEPFIEFSFISKDFAGRGRIYVINKYQYTILTLFSLSGINPDADRFIKSFKHLQ